MAHDAVAHTLSHWLAELKADLYSRTLPFWATHSIDGECGGYFNNLDEKGEVWDTTKHVWLQGRQAWMFAKLCNTHSEEELAALVEQWPSTLPLPEAVTIVNASATAPPLLATATPIKLTRGALLTAARAGVDFLREHAVRHSDGQVYFSLTREGLAVSLQRKIFSATFMIMALNEVGRAAGVASYREEALVMLERVLGWIRTPGSLRESMPGAPDFVPLNVPMILLNVINELAEGLPPAQSAGFYSTEREWAVRQILLHHCPEKAVVLESVQPDGSTDFARFEGRLVNPGHAIEAGWFLLDHARRTGDAELKVTALTIINDNFTYGWDPTNGGGILYFRDVLGYSPSQLEWDMKLWWPHAEAMIAFAMAFAETKERRYLDSFVKVAEWVYGHLVDRKHGEWYGYANRAGGVTHRFKGGPYKGCFHVPRALLMCIQSLEEASVDMQSSSK